MKNHVCINIGDHFASITPTVIQTTLGSCVAVCLFDPQKRIGGMNHILLPGAGKLEDQKGGNLYGINAMKALIGEIASLGGERKRLIGKIFGGANLMGTLLGCTPIGEKNAAFAVEYMFREGISVKSYDIGGTDTRIIKYHTDTGQVFLKRLNPKGFKRHANQNDGVKYKAKKPLPFDFIAGSIPGFK